MIGAKRRSNPLNLMRVMPPKEARVRAGLAISHAISRAWLFCYERYKSGKQELRKTIRVAFRFLFPAFLIQFFYE